MVMDGYKAYKCYLEAAPDEYPEYCFGDVCCGFYKKRDTLAEGLFVIGMICLVLLILYLGKSWLFPSEDQVSDPPATEEIRPLANRPCISVEKKKYSSQYQSKRVGTPEAQRAATPYNDNKRNQYGEKRFVDKETDTQDPNEQNCFEESVASTSKYIQNPDKTKNRSYEKDKNKEQAVENCSCDKLLDRWIDESLQIKYLQGKGAKPKNNEATDDSREQNTDDSVKYFNVNYKRAGAKRRQQQ